MTASPTTAEPHTPGEDQETPAQRAARTLPRPTEPCELLNQDGTWHPGFRAVSTLLTTDRKHPLKGQPCIKVCPEEDYQHAISQPPSPDGKWPMPNGHDWPLHAVRRTQPPDDEAYAPTDPQMLALIANPNDLPAPGQTIQILKQNTPDTQPEWQTGMRALSGPVRGPDGPSIWICWDIAHQTAQQHNYRPPAQLWPINALRTTH